MEYKLMNREELTNYILNFWLNWGIPEYQGTNEQLYDEIYENLGNFEGIEKELDSVRCEFEVGFNTDSLEYINLDKLWNYLNWYKTNFKPEVYYEK